MPKVTIKDKTKERQIKSHATLRYMMELNEVTTKDIARLLRISERTVYHRLKDPSTLTVAELRVLVDAFMMDEVELADLIGGI